MGTIKASLNRADHKKKPDKKLEGLMAGEENASYFTSQKKETLLKVCVHLVSLHCFLRDVKAS